MSELTNKLRELFSVRRARSEDEFLKSAAAAVESGSIEPDVDSITGWAKENGVPQPDSFAERLGAHVEAEEEKLKSTLPDSGGEGSSEDGELKADFEAFQKSFHEVHEPAMAKIVDELEALGEKFAEMQKSMATVLEKAGQAEALATVAKSTADKVATTPVDPKSPVLHQRQDGEPRARSASETLRFIQKGVNDRELGREDAMAWERDRRLTARAEQYIQRQEAS